MSYTMWKGRSVNLDEDIKEGIGMCDISGFMFRRRDLHKQMDWRGDSLQWTGLIVGAPYLDKPSPQLRPPPIKSDPKPIKDPRPPFPYFDPDSPPIDSYNQLVEKLNDNTFIGDEPPDLGIPGEVPGWPNDYEVPPYNQLVAQLRKVTFQ
jgi:hypothetical protein